MIQYLKLIGSKRKKSRCSICRKISNTQIRRSSGGGVACPEEKKSLRVTISIIFIIGAFPWAPSRVVGERPQGLPAPLGVVQPLRTASRKSATASASLWPSVAGQQKRSCLWVAASQQYLDELFSDGCVLRVFGSCFVKALSINWPMPVFMHILYHP